MIKTWVAYLRILRPPQWTKNALFVFAGFFFSQNFLKSPLEDYLRVLLAFGIFCLASGLVYVINDIADRHTDAKHPEKCNRPIANGTIPVPFAWIYAGVLVLITLVGGYFVNLEHKGFFIIVVSYIGLNILYSQLLKHIVLVDILVVAAGFLLRALAGTAVIGIEASAWLLLFTFSLALLLAASKRRHELQLAISDTGKRRVLKDYTEMLLNQIIGFATTSTLITYILYTILNPMMNSISITPNDKIIHHLWVSIPFVVYGVFRYLYIVYARKGGGNPEKVLVKDPHIMIIIGLYLLSVAGAMFEDRYSIFSNLFSNLFT